MVQKVAGPRMFTVTGTGLTSLRTGGSAGLDAICDGILKGRPFHMREDLLAEEAESVARAIPHGNDRRDATPRAAAPD